jgi:hypothetical protein
VGGCCHLGAGAVKPSGEPIVAQIEIEKNQELSLNTEGTEIRKGKGEMVKGERKTA